MGRTAWHWAVLGAN